MATRARRITAAQAQSQFEGMTERRRRAYVRAVGGPDQRRFTRAAHARGMAAAGAAGG